MSVPPSIDLQGLLAEDQWIRRLARKLAADPHAAEDLVQDAWVAALSARGPDSRPRALRPWLGGVVRNLWIDLKRVGDQRQRREQRVARGEELPSASELVSELELRKQVAAALLELDEPYRRALYLRFFRDQSLKSIAEAEGVSVTAIHERLQRGLARLRARLEREHGGERGSWATALLALVRPAGPWHAALETMAMASGLKVAAAVLVVGGVAWWWVDQERTAAPVSASSVPALAVEPGAKLAEPVLVPTIPPQREAVSAPASSAQLPAVATEAAARVRGRVVDAAGAPLASVGLAWSDFEAEPATSDARGAFELAAPPESSASAEHLLIAPGAANDHDIHCTDARYLTLVPGASDEHGERLVVVAPRASFGGVVLGADGAPLAGARVAFRIRDRLFRELGLFRTGVPAERPDGSALQDDGTRSDTRGRFELPDVAGGERVYLAVESDGYFDASADLPEHDDEELVVTLEPLTRGRELTGIVLDPRGAPLEGARVSAGDEIVKSDAEGRFHLRWQDGSGRFAPGADGKLVEVPSPELDPARELIALHAGFLPARVRLGALDASAPVVLQLGVGPLSISGRVVDPAGKPRAGIVVWFRDPTPFGRDILAIAEMTTAAMNTTVEEELGGGFGRRGTTSDAEGRFELGGLLERSYELLVFDPQSAVRAGPWTVDAGRRGIELVLTPEARTARVAGRIVSAAGQPLAGVQIRPQRAFGSTAYDAPPPRDELSITSDAQGAFAFESLALEGTSLVLMHPKLMIRSVALAPFADLEALEIVEPILCELQVDLTSDPTLADSVKVLDAAGAELETIESFGSGFTLGTEAHLNQGLSELLSVKETARTLVLRKNGVEIARRPLALDPENRTVIRP